MGDCNWLPVVGTLAGVVLGGLLSYVTNVTRLHQERKWQTTLQLREKLEEISSLCNDIYWRYAGSVRSMVDFVESRVEAPDLDLPKLGHLRTLTSSYASTLNERFTDVDEARDQLEKAVLEASRARGAERPLRQEANASLARAELRMKAACDSLSAAAATLVSTEIKRTLTA